MTGYRFKPAEETHNRYVTVALTDAEYAKLKKMAEKKKVTMSEIIRDMLRRNGRKLEG